jgi:hypothetical protein
MHFTFTVEVELTRSEGKFAARDELAEQIVEALESANPYSLTGENEGTYDIDEWDIVEQPQPPRKRRRKRTTTQEES